VHPADELTDQGVRAVFRSSQWLDAQLTPACLDNFRFGAAGQACTVAAAFAISLHPCDDRDEALRALKVIVAKHPPYRDAQLLLPRISQTKGASS
jgi:hypothetical protein